MDTAEGINEGTDTLSKLLIIPAHLDKVLQLDTLGYSHNRQSFLKKSAFHTWHIIRGKCPLSTDTTERIDVLDMFYITWLLDHSWLDQRMPIHRIVRCEKVNRADQITKSRVSVMESQGRYEKNKENDWSFNFCYVIWLNFSSYFYIAMRISILSLQKNIVNKNISSRVRLLGLESWFCQ